MSDTARRATRTLLQTVSGAFLVTGWQLFAPPDWRLSAEQAAWVVALLSALISVVQNAVEAGTGRALLKTPLEKEIARSGG